MSGKLATVIDQIEHGHHVYRAYFKHAFLKQYEKFSTFLRNELCSNNLKDFALKKSLDNLQAVREKFQTITDRFAGFQAQWLNGRVGEDVTTLAPHRSGRADFQHPVPHARVSLTMSWTTISAVLHTDTHCWGDL
jgi:hypothetical protein